MATLSAVSLASFYSHFAPPSDAEEREEPLFSFKNPKRKKKRKSFFSLQKKQRLLVANVMSQDYIILEQSCRE